QNRVGREGRQVGRDISRHPQVAPTFAGYALINFSSESAIGGSTPVSGVGESVPLSRTFPRACFGEGPKPTPETGVLPNPRRWRSSTRHFFQKFGGWNPQKAPSFSCVMKVVTIIARILLGLIFVFFGSNAFLRFLPMPELPKG